MKILILHAVADPRTLRRTTLNQSFVLPKHAPEHDYTFQCYGHDIPDEVRSGAFDVIVLDTTFLCYRWIRPRPLFDMLLQDYDFVRRSRAVKIALPQDDYDHSEVLDRWLTDWGVSVVFSPIPQFKEVLYPRTSQSAAFELALTGYIDPVDVALLERFAKPHNERSRDVGFRARALPFQFGRVGRLKSDIGRIFEEHLPSGQDLTLDISNRPEDVFAGENWLRFLGDCRFLVGSVSGSSVIDPDGQVREAVEAYLTKHPGASFEEVEASCFPGQDGVHHMTAIGPRNLEAVAARTCQILVPDEGLAPLEPDIHYIALASDASNIKEVLEQMRDPALTRARMDAAWELIVGSGDFGCERFAERILKTVGFQGRTGRAAPSGSAGTAAESAILLRLFDPALAHVQRIADHHYGRINELTSQLNDTAREAERFRDAANQADFLRERLERRTGAKGLLREVLRINSFLDAPEGPARRAPAVRLYRAWRAWRSLGPGGVIACARVKLDTARLNRNLARAPKPRSVTMLVPDDRVDRRVLLSARSLQQAGWRVTVIGIPYPGEVDEDQLVFPDIRIVRVETRFQIPEPPLTREEARQLSGIKDHRATYFYHRAFLQQALLHPAEVYVAHDLPVLPAATIAAKEKGAHLAYDAHELYPEQHHFGAAQRELYREAEADLIRHADLVYTVNDSIAEEMAHRHRIARPSVIWNAPDADPSCLPIRGEGSLHEKLGIPADRRILLLQGSLSVNRNLETLVRSMAHVTTPDVTCVIMGPGDEKRAELQAIASDLRLPEDKIRFALPVSQDQLLRFTASADVGIIPYPPIDMNSTFCTPNKLFEYIVAGLPILANDLPELRRFVLGNGFGSVHPMATPEQLAEGIDGMFASELAAYRRNLLDRRRQFIWKEQGSKLATLFAPWLVGPDL